MGCQGAFLASRDVMISSQFAFRSCSDGCWLPNKTRRIRPNFWGRSRTKNQPQRGNFWEGHPADIQGSFVRISRPKTSVRAVKILEKQAFRRGHPWPEGADVHDPKGFPKTSVRKTLGWIAVPEKENWFRNPLLLVNAVQIPLKE